MANTTIEQSAGQRFLVSLPVRAEWQEEKTGNQIVVQGTTENVGPTSALVALDTLPTVGSRIQISIEGTADAPVETEAEVVRLVRDLRQPLASISVVKRQQEWRGKVWKRAGVLASRVTAEVSDDEDSVH